MHFSQGIGMSKLAAIIIGHNQWERWTLPLIRSIQEHEPLCQIVVVDNDSDPPYPKEDGVTLAWADNESVAKAINAGIYAAGWREWYLVLDNDVTCTGPFMHRLEEFEEGVIYGAEMKTWREFPFLIGWCTFIPRDAWVVVGKMDEEYVRWGYQEVDWLWRAEQAGYKQAVIDAPFKHHAHGSHQYVKDMDHWRKVNQQRFLEKAGIKCQRIEI